MCNNNKSGQRNPQEGQTRKRNWIKKPKKIQIIRGNKKEKKGWTKTEEIQFKNDSQETKYNYQEGDN